MTYFAPKGSCFLAIATVLACGCGSGPPGLADTAPDGGQETLGDAGEGDGSLGTDSSFVPASQAPLPQVISFGGPVLANPKVQPIAYTNDVGLSDMNAFLHELTQTAFWAQGTSEYGVGALTVLPTIAISDPPPGSITDAQLTASLAANTSGPSPAWGPADPSTIYLFLLPTGSIEADSQGSCCSAYDAYHSETKVGTTSVPYAVSCSCPGFDGPSITDIAERTVNISHELVEAATEPFPYSNPSWGREDDPNVVWTLTTVGEVADMCEFNNDAYFIPPGATYMIQRVWSDKAARAFLNPCVPQITSAPYFGAAPQLGSVRYPLQGGGSITTAGVKLALGQTKTIDLTLFSEGPMPGPFRVTPYDFGYLLGGASNLALALDRTSGQNGDTLHLTIRAVSSNPTIGGEAFILYCEYGEQGKPGYVNNLSMGLVLN
jgi:hypothetical protein